MMNYARIRADSFVNYAREFNFRDRVNDGRGERRERFLARAQRRDLCLCFLFIFGLCYLLMAVCMCVCGGGVSRGAP